MTGTELTAADPVALEIATLESEMGVKGSEYWRNERRQKRYRDLVSARDRIPSGNPDAWRRSPEDARSRFTPDLVAEWDARGGFAVNLAKAQDAVALTVAGIDDQAKAERFIAGFDALPVGVQCAIFREAAADAPGFTGPATEDELAAFRKLPGGAEALKQWGGRASRSISVAMTRWLRCVDSMSKPDRQTFTAWWTAIEPRQKLCVLWTLGSAS